MSLYSLALKYIECVPTTTKKEFIFLSNDKISCNKASSYCMTQYGGNLVLVHSEVIINVIKKFKASWTSWDEKFCIGLYITDDNLADVTWQGTCNTYSTSYRFYDCGNSVCTQGSDKMCVMALDDTLKWVFEKCGDPSYKAICERSLGPCTYQDSVQGTCFQSSDSGIVSKSGIASMTDCKDECSSYSSGSDECWAVSFGSGECLLATGKDPYEFENGKSHYKTSGCNSKTVSWKRCFKSDRDNNNVPNGPSDSATASYGTCSAAPPPAPTTTTTTTTTTAPPTTTTTTAPPTTTTTTAPPTTTTTTAPPTTTTTTAPTTTTTTSAPPTTTTTTAPPTTTTTTAPPTTTTTTAPPTTTKTTAQPATTTTGQPTITTAASTTSTSATIASTVTSPSTTSETSLTTTSAALTTVTDTTSGNTVVTQGLCTCRCTTAETLSMEETLKQLKSQLSVDKKKTSSYLRTLVSAEDNRPSATGMGYVLGVGIIAGVTILLMLGDAIKALNWVSTHFRAHNKTLADTEKDA